VPFSPVSAVAAPDPAPLPPGIVPGGKSQSESLVVGSNVTRAISFPSAASSLVTIAVSFGIESGDVVHRIGLEPSVSVSL
jgi:hypothetical protein